MGWKGTHVASFTCGGRIRHGALCESVTVMSDGRILLLYKSTRGQWGRLLYGAAVADQLEGPCRRLTEDPIFNAAQDSEVNIEDFHIWQEDGVPEAIFEDTNGHLDINAGLTGKKAKALSWGAQGFWKQN